MAGLVEDFVYYKLHDARTIKYGFLNTFDYSAIPFQFQCAFLLFQLPLFFHQAQCLFPSICLS